MLLSDNELKLAIKAGEVSLSPYDSSRLQPGSIDVTLGRQFRFFDPTFDGPIDPYNVNPQMYASTTLNENNELYELPPWGFVLGHTVEVVTLSPAVAARLEGKSSLGRLGLMVHSTAGWIDPGFTGQVTLELSNLSPLPILLYPGMPIGQLCVMRLSSPASVPYGHRELGSRYQGQMGATPSRSVDNQ